MEKIVTSSVMVASLTLVQSASATIIASWDVWNDTNEAGGLAADDTADPSITASISEIDPIIRGVQGANGNTDGTFGPTLIGADTTGGERMRIEKRSDFQTGDFAINIENQTGVSITLDELLFDYNYSDFDVHETYNVVFENQTQNTTTGVLGSGTFTTLGWHNIDIDASSVTLANDDTGRFVLSISSASSGGNSSVGIDNVAVTITTAMVPEPVSLTLFALGGLGLIGFCRRQRQRRR